MGALYLAWDPRLDRQIAIKLLMHDDDELRERFAREARSAARLRHPHIVTIFDVGEHNNQPFITMEYIQGQTLAAIVRSRAELPLQRKLKLAEELCDGLGFAHKAGVIHRDVKPANAIVDAHGALKILDFGIARLGESSGMTQAGMMMGTLNYMSPEQLMGRPADSRSDIFAVGAVCYELLSYKQAFPGGLESGIITRIVQSPPQPLDELCSGIDPEIVRIISRALDKDPSARYQELGQMSQELQRIRLRLDRQAEGAAVGEGQSTTPTPTTGTSTIRRIGDREELARRRLTQIQSHLESGRRAFEHGELEAALGRCEEALLLDADHAGAIDLLDQVRAALDARQADDLLSDAEGQIRLGALTAAQALIERAAALGGSGPRVASLRAGVDDALREREQLRRRSESIQQALDRAHVAFDRGEFERAVAAADEALGLQADHGAAAAVRDRAISAIAQQERDSLDRRARDTVREANRLFSAGNHQAALDLLAAFDPAHELVSRAQEGLRGEVARIEEEHRAKTERRARKSRIASELSRARREIGEHDYDVAAERLRRLELTEGSAPEIAAALREVAHAQKEQAAAVARQVQAHLADAEALLQISDFDNAQARVVAALQLDAANAHAIGLRDRIGPEKRAFAERQAAERARVEQQRREQQRLEQERVEQQRREQQRVEQERLEQQRERLRTESEQRHVEREPDTNPFRPEDASDKTLVMVPPVSASTADPAAAVTLHRDVVEPVPAPSPRPPDLATAPVGRRGAGATSSRRPMWIGAAAVVLVLVALGLWRPWSADDPAPGGGTPGPGGGEPTELVRFRQDARQLLGTGDYVRAVESVAAGLEARRDDPELTALAGLIVTAVSNVVETERKQAASLFRGRPPQEFQEADRLRAEFANQSRAGQHRQAVLTGLDAAERFTRFAAARAAVNKAAATKVAAEKAAAEKAAADKAAAEKAAAQKLAAEKAAAEKLAAEKAAATKVAAEKAAAEKLAAEKAAATKAAAEKAAAEEAAAKALAEKNAAAKAAADKAAAEKAAAGAREAEERAVMAVVQAYVSAYNDRSPARVKAVFPSADERVLTKNFESLRSQSVSTPGLAVNVTGTTATASGSWVVVSEDLFGRNQKGSTQFRLQLQKSGNSWIIVARQ
jgi:hypothetical protein